MRPTPRSAALFDAPAPVNMALGEPFLSRRDDQAPASSGTNEGLRIAMIITPVILGVLVLALLAYFGYAYLRRRAERKQRDAERTVSPFTFGGLRRAVDLAAEIPPSAPEPQAQQTRSPRSPRAGRGRRTRGIDEKVDHSAHGHGHGHIKMKEDRTVVPVFFAPAAQQVVTRRPSTTAPVTQPYPLPTGKERDPFDALDEQSPTTPATRKGRGAAPTPINPVLSPPADNTGAVNGAHLPFTPLPQYPASAHAQETDVRPSRRRTHAPVTLDTRRFKLRVVNAGNKSRSSSSRRTHSANPSSSGSVSKTRPISASTHSTSSGVPEPPTYTRPPSYANSHASNNGRTRSESAPLTTLLSLIGASRGGDSDSAGMTSPVSAVSGGTALRDSGLFPSGASTGDYKGHQSRKSYASTRRSLASLQDVQAVPGPSSRPMTPPVPALPVGTPSPLSPATSFMQQDPVASRRVSVASYRRSKRSTKGKLEPLKATGGPLSTPPVTTPMSANPPTSANARSSMASEMDITSIRAQVANESPEGSNVVIRGGHQRQQSLDAKSARSVDVTSLYRKGKHVRRGSAGSDDGVPAIPPLPMQTPFEFDLGFGGVPGSIGAISEESHVTGTTDAASTSALLQRSASIASSSVASPLGPAMPFPGSAETSTVPAKYSVAEWKAADPWQRPSVSRSASAARKVRRKPVPSEASFTSYGSETALLKGMERSDSIGSP